MVEEKSDTMYYISMERTVMLGIFAGVAAAGATCGAGASLLGIGAAGAEELYSERYGIEVIFNFKPLN